MLITDLYIQTLHVSSSIISGRHFLLGVSRMARSYDGAWCRRSPSISRAARVLNAARSFLVRCLCYIKTEFCYYCQCK